jgi:hypothetical protein
MFAKTLHHFLPIRIQIVWQTTFIILKDELQNEKSLNYGAITITFKEQTIISHVENLLQTCLLMTSPSSFAFMVIILNPIYHIL